MNRTYYRSSNDSRSSKRGSYTHGGNNLNRNQSQNQNNNFRSGGTRSQGGRKMTTFNPSLLVNEVKEQVAAVEFVSKYAFSDFNLDQRLYQNILDKG